MTEQVSMPMEVELRKREIDWQAFGQLDGVREWLQLSAEERSERFYPPTDVRIMARYAVLSYLLDNSGHDTGPTELVERLEFLHNDNLRSVGLDSKTVKIEMSRMMGSQLTNSGPRALLNISDVAKAREFITSTDQRLEAGKQSAV